MRFDGELTELAKLLRIGAETARTIAGERGRDEAEILRLANQADGMADDIARIVDEGADGSHYPDAVSLRLRRDR